jgi:hypothetical protein
VIEPEFILDVASARTHGMEGQTFGLDPRTELALAGDDGIVAPGAQLQRHGDEGIEISERAAGRKYDLPS